MSPRRWGGDALRCGSRAGASVSIHQAVSGGRRHVSTRLAPNSPNIGGAFFGAGAGPAGGIFAGGADPAGADPADGKMGFSAILETTKEKMCPEPEMLRMIVMCDVGSVSSSSGLS